MEPEDRWPYRPDKPAPNNPIQTAPLRGGIHDGKVFPVPAEGVLVFPSLDGNDDVYWFRQEVGSWEGSMVLASSVQLKNNPFYITYEHP